MKRKEEKKDGDKHASSPDDNRKTSSGEPKPKRNDENEKTDEGSNDVFESIAGPFSELGLPYWDYDLDTAIHDHLEGTTYKVRESAMPALTKEFYSYSKKTPTNKKLYVY